MYANIALGGNRNSGWFYLYNHILGKIRISGEIKVYFAILIL